ncbi:hypothetical protein ACLMJK_003705 [Lecanora helva]
MDFLRLPLEIRIAIYTLAVDYPELSVSFDRAWTKHCSAFKDFKKRGGKPTCMMRLDYGGNFVTPTVLLLNRQITSEALVELQKKTLRIPGPPPKPDQLAKPLDIITFIGESVLQIVRNVAITMDFNAHGSRGWLRAIENLLDIWMQANNLQSLRIHIVDFTTITTGQDDEIRSILASVDSLLSFAHQITSNTPLAAMVQYDGASLVRGQRA